MILRLVWRGHRGSLFALIGVILGLAGVIAGVLSVAVSAGDHSNRIRARPPLNTVQVQRINDLDGLGQYSVLVTAIAVVAGVLMLAAIAQFFIASTESTLRSLRVYGISQRRIRGELTLLCLAAGLIAFIGSLALAPLAGWIHRATMEKMGFEVQELSIFPPVGLAFWVAMLLAVWTALVTYRVSGKTTELDARPARRLPAWRIVGLCLRVVVFVGIGAGLVALLRMKPDLQNVTPLVFGAVFAALLAAWCAMPVVLCILGWLAKPFGAGGLASGGLISSNAIRISGIAIISALLLGLGGATAILTLAANSGSRFLALNSFRAHAVTTGDTAGQGLERAARSGNEQAAGIETTPFDIDEGWIYEDRDAQKAPILLLDPPVAAGILAPGSVVAGSLADVGGTRVLAPESRYELGDSIRLRSDSGGQVELTVVALGGKNSLVGTGLTANANDFEPSAPEKVWHRAYATAPGGLQQIRAVDPNGGWQSIEESVHQQLAAEQQSKMNAVVSMIGGVAVVAFFGLLYSVVQFSIDHRRTVWSLRRIGASRAARTWVLAVVAGAIVLASTVFTFCSLGVASWKVQEMMDSLGVTYPLEVPWGSLLGAWAALSVVVFVGMFVGQKQVK